MHHPPDLEERFTEPPGWRWHSFERKGRRIRFGTVSPQGTVPKATIVCLPGLSEFCEKYFEIARDLVAKNYAFWVIDWAGQGKSSRPLSNPLKRHSYGFDDDIEDFHDFIDSYVWHASVDPKTGRIPLVMLAHSMGGNIGLRYLQHYPQAFKCAGFSAPMIGIHALQSLPKPLAMALARTLNTALGKSFTSGHGRASRKQNQVFANNVLTSDPIRFTLMERWMNFDPELRIGDVTFGWVYQALKSCYKVQNPDFLKSIETPCLLGYAEHESITDNAATLKAAKILPKATPLELQGSQHEILMERDEIRNVFLKVFDDLIRTTLASGH